MAKNIEITVYRNQKTQAAFLIDDEWLILPNGRVLSFDLVSPAWEESQEAPQEIEPTPPQLAALTKMISRAEDLDHQLEKRRAEEKLKQERQAERQAERDAKAHEKSKKALKRWQNRNEALIRLIFRAH